MEKNRKLKPGPKPAKGRVGAKHGEGKSWQFRFEKTENNASIEEIFWCRSREDFEKRSGLKLDPSLEWDPGRFGIVENILITLGRRVEKYGSNAEKRSSDEKPESTKKPDHDGPSA